MKKRLYEITNLFYDFKVFINCSENYDPCVDSTVDKAVIFVSNIVYNYQYFLTRIK